MLENAKIYAKLAKQQTDMLGKVMNELEDQRAAQSELQTALDNHLNDTTQVNLWTATSFDANAKPKGILYGNGILTRTELSPHNRAITSIKTGKGSELISNINYAYDEYNNVSTMSNAITNEDHTYQYDTQDRVTNWLYSNDSLNIQKDYHYNTSNNLSYKTTTGNMVYNDANQLISRIDDNNNLYQYFYDANGNQTKSTGTTNARDIEYTAFNKTKKLMTQTANGAQTNEITYDANNNRIIQKAYYDTSTSTNPSKVTYHINKGYELIQTTDEHSNQITIHRHHLYAGGKVVVTYDKTIVNGKKAVDQAGYLHTDALGNITAVTGNDGNLKLSPFGEHTTQGLSPSTSTGHF